MKNLKLLAFSLIIMLCMIVTVNAESISSWSDLKACLESEGKATCQTSGAITEDDSGRIKINGEKDLILGGDLTVKTYIWVTDGATLNVDGNIKSEGRIMFFAYPGGTLNLNSGKYTSIYETTDPADIGNIVAVYGSATEEGAFTNVNVSKGVELLNGGIYVYPVSSSITSCYNVNINFAGKLSSNNGLNANLFSIHGLIKEGNAVITIKEGAEILGGDAPGIYAAGVSHLIVEGGKISGVTGIEIRSGKLEVKGGTITGTSSTLTSNSNGSGSTSTGAGIAVAQHTTNNPIDVTITGGTIQGVAALYENTPETNPMPEKVTLSITGGSFEAINGGTEAVLSENITKFVSGGTYSTEVSDALLASSELTTKEENGITYVGKESNVIVSDSDNGTVKVDKETAVEGQTVTITATPNEGYEIDKTVVEDVQGKTITVTDGTFVMGSYDVEVTVTFKKVEDKKDETPVVNPTDKNDTTDETDNNATTSIPAIPETPKTSDNILLYVALGFISIAGIILALKNLKKEY